MNLLPATVKEYLPATRQCRIEIPPLTNGASTLPLADILYGIGDKASKARQTEMRILPGDMVWVSFIGGDPRYPIIVGYRNPLEGNDVGWRRWEHENMEWLIDKVANMISQGTITLKANSTITIDSGSSVLVKAPSVTAQCSTATISASGSTSIQSPSTTISGSLTVGGKATLSGGLAVSGGSSLGGGGTMTGSLRVNGSITASGSIKENS